MIILILILILLNMTILNIISTSSNQDRAARFVPSCAVENHMDM
jgi:hypothetical protein